MVIKIYGDEKMRRWSYYDPFEEILREMDEILERANRYVQRVPVSTNYDIFIEGNKVKIVVELPGVQKRDIHVRFPDEETINISVERKSERELEYGVSRFYSGFNLTLSLPGKVEVKKARARYNNGVLEVEVPLKEPEKIKGYEIKVE